MIEHGDGPPNRWIRLATTTLTRSPWFEVRRDDAVRPDGSRGSYDHVVAPDSVTVLAIFEDGSVAVTRQWIYVHHEAQWRLPAGRVDITDADPESAARRELAEETGLSADHWSHLGTVHCADSFTNHRDHAFLASGLRTGEPELEPGETDLRVHRMPFTGVLNLVIKGRMPHAGSAFAVLMTQMRGLPSSACDKRSPFPADL